MALATLPPPQPVYEVRQDYEFSGNVARELLNEYDAALNQLNDRPSMMLMTDRSIPEVQRVPFAKAGKIKVRFKHPRPMTPRHVAVDDGSNDD